MPDEQKPQPRYRLRSVITSLTSDNPSIPSGLATSTPQYDPFLRPATEDDDGYDPYSDRPADAEPIYQEDPWR